jgi:hypothetical protein
MNSKIIIAAVVIGGSGIANHWLNNQPITGVVIGSYILLLVLAILDTFGGPFSKLSGALAMLAMVYVLLTEFPWSAVIALAQGKKA